jgi:ceramide glucosyltransferase
VECRSDPIGWAAVWKHQLRWARTIRVCQPGPYFMSILSNSTLWPVLWVALSPGRLSGGFAVLALLVRAVTGRDLWRRLTRRAGRASLVGYLWVKDLLQVLLWAGAFAGNRIEWRGERMRLRRDGTLVRDGARRSESLSAPP